MTLLQLEERPKDLGYIKNIERTGAISVDRLKLRELLQQRAFNIAANGYSYAMINDLENVIAENGYKACFVPIANSTAYADFFLIKS